MHAATIWEKGDYMGRVKENPKYGVLSVRVTEKEKRIIRNLATKHKMNVTSLVRDLIFSSGLIIKAE